MKTTNIFTMLLLVASSCAPAPSPESGESRAAAPTVNGSPVPGSPTPRAGGGDKDLRPRGLLLFSPRGASATGTAPTFTVRASCTGVACADRASMAATVGSHLSFVTADGKTISAISEKQGEVGIYESEDVRVRPTAELPSDAWVSLRLTSDSEIVLGAADDSAEESIAALDASRPHTTEVPFFTGSLPHVLAALRTAAEGKSPALQIFFSEPLAIADLVEGLSLETSAGPLSGCVWSAAENACATKASPGRVLGVDFQISDKSADLSRLSIGVAGRLKGVERDVAEAASFCGLEAKLDSFYFWDTLAADWQSCSSTGDTLCARKSSF